MKISVAVAACRGGRFIGAQLASIAAQSRLPDEVIICDDGPDEATALAVQKFSGELPLTYQINPVPLGVTGNFNKVLSLSTGEVVFLCDQDDVWYPQKIAEMSRFFAPGKIVGAFCDSDIADENGNVTGVTHLETRGYGNLRRIPAGVWQGQFAASCRRFPAAGHDMAVSAALLKKLLPLPELPACHDNYLGIAAAALGAWRIYPGSLGIFRRHGASCSGAGRKMSLIEQWHEAQKSVKDNTFAWNAALFQAVLSRLPELPDEVRLMLQRRMEHSRNRAAMNTGFWKRLPLICREIGAGNYRKFGRGWKNVVQDLFLR